MKKLFFPFSIMLIFSLLTMECGKDPLIEYPDTGDFGESIIQEGDLTIEPSTDIPPVENLYSMKAVLPEEASLKVVIECTTPIEDGGIGTIPSSMIGWSKNNESVGVTVFTAFGPVTADVKIEFYGQGTAELSIYENGAEEPNRTKTLSW
ncbi:MAG: hypothetical protein JW801_06290 [Bacteroidales bacterium]|nr:hypothetical protein [Bacteroidales bacterium]